MRSIPQPWQRFVVDPDPGRKASGEVPVIRSGSSWLAGRTSLLAERPG